MKKQPSIVKTADGSITCFDEETGEMYHNEAGAYAEALVNFIEPSDLLRRCREQEHVSFIDLPFGLGYNTFLFLQQLLDVPNPRASRVTVIGVEQDPYVMSILDQVLQDERFMKLKAALPDGNAILDKLSRFAPVSLQIQGVAVEIHCRQGDIRKLVPPMTKDKLRFDAILHDPFSPSKMPELWSLELFEIYCQLLKPHGRVLTYSAAVAVRSGLKQAGFSVYRTTALGGKTGGTLASKQPLLELPAGIYQLTPSEDMRLKSRSGVPYRDPQFNCERKEIIRTRAKEQSLQ